MIKIDRKVIDSIRSAKSGADLWSHLQNAVKLEHSTIPPYLTALFSLKPGTNQEIAALIRSVMVQEMLHMTISANVLIAIGGHPQINTKDFIPTYPGPLPLNIGDLRVGIEAFSILVVENVFMKIEEPEHPIDVKKLLGAEEEKFATIGLFYDAIKEQIGKLGQRIFTHTSSPPQVVASRWFPPEKLFPITGPDSAARGIDLIKLEGEGTSTDPFQSPGDLAHFYKFGEIAAGKAIIKTPTGYAYGGAPIPFDSSGVWPLRPNCKIADYAPDTQARTRITDFAYNYSNLLNALHNAFNTDPSQLDAAIGLMYDLRVLSAALMQTADPTKPGFNVGPSFEYVQAETGM
ncbi:MAG TPA: ferritin-like protein [Bryobacteraceae bacterium]|jgi:hypothetical protein